MVLIAPSLLSADFSCLQKEIKLLEQAKADWLHFDVMDGHFVPNLTFGPMIIKSLRPYSKLFFDVHLMVENPIEMLPWFIKSGADSLTVHYEACKNFNNLKETLSLIKKANLKVGISIKPDTPVKVLADILDYIDLVLIMTVNPGFGGQSFMENQVQKIIELKNIIGNRNIKISVDGGINIYNKDKCIQAGADVLVAGTAVFCGGKYAENIANLR